MAIKESIEYYISSTTSSYDSDEDEASIAL